MGTKILVEDFKFLQYTELKQLHLDSNRIEMIEHTAIRYLPKTIKFVSVSDNKFTFGKYVEDVFYLENMQKINISAEHSSHPVHEMDTCNESSNDPVPYCASTNNPNLEITLGNLHVNSKDHNMITKFKGRRSSEILNSSSSHVMPRKIEDQSKYYKEDPFIFHIVDRNKGFFFPVPKALQVIYGNSSNLRFPISELYFSNNNITHFYLQDNSFYSWDGPVHNLNSIKVLNLSNNFCSYVSENFFQYAESLTELYLGNNILGFSLASDMKGLIFRNLRKLEILDLKENRISTLPKTVFQNLVNLKYLDLSKNFLKAWEINTSHIKIVYSIDLSNNEITCLSDGDMKAFDRLGSTKNLTMNFLKNSFMCTCRTINFMKWMEKRNKTMKINFLQFDNYNCTEDAEHESKVLKFDKIKSHILNLQRECRSYTAIIFVTTGTLVCFLFILCTGLTYRYRWKLRYFYYMTKSRYHQYKSLRGENLPLNQYDAFVSYADEDRSFVLRMIKELEEEEGIKLCIHQRDFVPGFDIAENIITAVNKSRKTIILLSPNFIKSSWCMYELHIAKMEEIYSRNDENVIFLILYETLPLKDIPLTLMDLINQKTYIEFPNGDHDQEFSDDVFWSTLKGSFQFHGQTSGEIIFESYEQYFCEKESHDGQVMNFTNYKVIGELRKKCNTYTALIFMMSTLIFLFAISLTVGIFYRYRWKLRYFFYMTKSRYHGYKAVRSESQSDFKYDAFVSYADEDLPFVQKMILELEKNNEIRLCIHHRDFVPGYDIAENIITAVNKSRKTIIILSPNFINSSWCMYEMHIAKMEEIYSRDDQSVLVIIFYKPIPAGKIPLQIMNVIKEKSYIEFPDDEYCDAMFWRKVIETVKNV
ncbi:toll-like receptor 4 [Saccostrea cucullata]|uniref:toll-like receptor 4 n=1 Tax=Saccostrea cuccullata TaxID=36930 RepID=UPI002ED67605